MTMVVKWGGGGKQRFSFYVGSDLTDLQQLCLKITRRMLRNAPLSTCARIVMSPRNLTSQWSIIHVNFRQYLEVGTTHFYHLTILNLVFGNAAGKFVFSLIVIVLIWSKWYGYELSGNDDTPKHAKSDREILHILKIINHFDTKQM